MEKIGKAIIAQFGLAVTIVIATLSVTRLAASTIDTWGPAALEVGGRAPAFHLQTPNGAVVDQTHFSNKITVLVYTSDKNPLSAKYHNRIADLVNSYRGDPRIAIAEISTGKFAAGAQQNLNHAVLIDTGHQFAAAYSVTMAPMCFVIDSAGILRYSGSFDDNADSQKVSRHYVADAVSRLLDGRPVEITATQPFGMRVVAN